MPGTRLEAVPNISEGRDDAVIDAVCDAARGAGATLADLHVDPDHHRSVLTLLGDHEQIVAALAAVVVEASARIDLGAHAGVHPRVGACDVAPVVPLAGLVEDGGDEHAATQAALAVCERVSDAGLPVIRYGIGADAAHGFAGAVRAGGPGALAARIEAGEVDTWRAGQVPLPASGITLVGVRNVLVAFNVNLRTGVERAQEVARAIRERDGGLLGVRALGLPLLSRDLVQVSTNIERWEQVGLADVLEAVIDEAGIDAVAGCELVGLAPAAALDQLGELLATCGVRLAAAAEPRLESHLARSAR